MHPDLPLETALRYVDRWPLVPVVSRADFRQLEGVISQRDVLERYREFGEKLEQRNAVIVHVINCRSAANRTCYLLMVPS